MALKLISLFAIFLIGCGDQRISEVVINQSQSSDEMPLNPISMKSSKLIYKEENEERYYIPSTPENILWGDLPSATTETILTVPSGSEVVIDTISHEGVLREQGRNPLKFFSSRGVNPDMILEDVIALAESDISHDSPTEAPHIVTGPIGVENAKLGDVLRVDILKIVPRVPYGVISNRHEQRSLSEEYSLGPERDGNSLLHNLEADRAASAFVSIIKRGEGNNWLAIMESKNNTISFPIKPFMGVIGVAPTPSEVHSTISGSHGGHLNIKELVEGTSLYLPVFVDQAKFYTGDPKMAQGKRDVVLTGLRNSLRVTIRLTLLEKGNPQIPSKSGFLNGPIAETDKYWITIGFDDDFDMAMKKVVKESTNLLNEVMDVSREMAAVYLSVATDFEVSQVVNKVKRIYALIRKSDFKKEVDYGGGAANSN